MSGARLARALLALLAAALVLAAIGLVVGVSRQRGEQVRTALPADEFGCLTCHGDPSYDPKSTDRPWRELYVDESTLTASTHGPIQCTSCHVTFDTGQPIEKAAAQEICGTCHAQEMALLGGSVHADVEVATCLDCHSPKGTAHDIPPVLAATSPVAPMRVPETCGGCHADRDLAARYELKPDVYDVYQDSPHAKVIKLSESEGSGLRPATCLSCHGSHDVTAVDDPKSPLSSAAGRASVCGSCHTGANEDFVRALTVHEEPTSEERPLLYYAERFFFMLTASVVSLGLLMVGLEAFGWLRRRSNGEGGRPNADPRDPPPSSGEPPVSWSPGERLRGSAVALNAAPLVLEAPVAAAPFAPPEQELAAPAVPQEIVRFDVHQRIQHLLMMSSFLVLVFTGMPQKFPDWEVSQWLIGVWGGLDSARIIHRFAGLVMIVDCVYHLGYVLYGTAVLKRPPPVWMFPTPRDVADFFQDLRYWFGRSAARPQFGRFSYREKFDYWAIFWGMPVMAGSGLILMFATLATKVLPGDAVSVALIAHSDEALLALLWIFIVHFFFVHINPRFFPLNRAIFSGRMPRRLYAEEHPLELAALDARRQAGGAGGSAAARPRPGDGALGGG